MEQFNRRYAIRKVIIRAQWGFGAGLVFTWVLLIAERAAFLFVAIVVVSTLATLWQCVDVVRNGGVRETPEGITNRRVLAYRRWRWEDIEKFANVRSRVYVVTRDRLATPLAGINEGWRNIWDGGETREITAVLNERLAAWRSQRSRHATEVPESSSNAEELPTPPR